jgi:hypothetical protein
MYTTCGKTMVAASPKMGRKIKKSFSISVESDSFIRNSCKERKSNSESETLDALLTELMNIRKQQAIEAAYTDYYDSLADDEMAEQLNWGSFAESQLTQEDLSR